MMFLILKGITRSPPPLYEFVKEDVFFLESYQNDLYIFLETWISISQRVEEPQIL